MTPDSTVETIHRSLGRLEGKMDLMLQNMNAHLTEDTARFKLMDDRINDVEKRQERIDRKVWTAIGGIGVLWAGLQLGLNKIFS